MVSLRPSRAQGAETAGVQFGEVVRGGSDALLAAGSERPPASSHGGRSGLTRSRSRSRSRKSTVIEFRAPASPAQSFSAGRPGRCLGPARDVLRLGSPDGSPPTAGPQPRDVLRPGSPEGSPRTAGPQPRDVLRLGSPECSPPTAGPQPRDVLRLALRPGGGSEGGLRPPSEVAARA